jgi:hypothetical protein
MPSFRSLAAALIVVVCLAGTVRLGLCWVVEMVASPQPVTTKAGPHLQLVTDQLDLGDVSSRQPLAARFVIANTGTQPLVFRRAGQGCCGRDVPPPTTTIEPGRTGEIVLELAPAELADGQQRFGFLTNDPAQPEFWLTVRRQASPAAPPREEHSVLVKRK